MDLTKIKQLLAAAQKQFSTVEEIKIDREDKFKDDALDGVTEIRVDNQAVHDPLDTLTEKNTKDRQHLARPEPKPQAEEEEEHRHRSKP